MRTISAVMAAALVGGLSVFAATDADAKKAAKPNAGEEAVLDDKADVLAIWLRHQKMVQALPALSVAVVRGDAVVFADAAGTTAGPKGGAFVTPATPWFVGSVTKVLTAAMVLRLVEEERLSLSTPVRAILPDFRKNDAVPITIRHLLRHSSGLPREVVGHPYWVTYDFPTTSELVQAMNASVLAFTPGTKTQYSNAGFGILGAVIEKVTETTLEQAVGNAFAQPLSLDVTTLRPTEVERQRAPTSFTQRKRYLDGRRAARPIGDAGAMAAAFGALSTPTELARFGCFLASHRRLDLLSAASRERLFYGENKRHDVGRGLGMKREKHGERIFLSHTGWFSGYRTHLAIAPEQELCVAVAATADDAKVRSLAFTLLASLLDQKADGASASPSPALPSATRTLVGTYGVQWLPDFDLVVHQGALYQYVPSSAADAGVFEGLAKVRHTNTRGRETVEILDGNWGGSTLVVHRDGKGRVKRLVHDQGLLIFERRPAMPSSRPVRGAGGSGGG